MKEFLIREWKSLLCMILKQLEKMYDCLKVWESDHTTENSLGHYCKKAK